MTARDERRQIGTDDNGERRRARASNDERRRGVVQTTTETRGDSEKLQMATDDEGRTSIVCYSAITNTEYIYKTKNLRNKRGEIKNDIIT